MDLGFFAYALPFWGAIKTMAALHPKTYIQYEEASDSPYSASIKKIAQRVLNREMESKGAYQERIQEMIQGLPDTGTAKDVSALIAHRLRVVAIKNSVVPIHSTGIDTDKGEMKGKFFIAIDPKIDATTINARHWIAAHEICHILEGDGVEIAGIKTVASLLATFLSNSLLKLGLLSSFGIAVTANVVTHVIVSHRAENRADAFANKHCSEKECKKAIEYFQRWKASRPQSGIQSYLGAIFRSALHPSEEARIKNIEKALRSRQALLKQWK